MDNYNLRKRDLVIVLAISLAFLMSFSGTFALAQDENVTITYWDIMTNPSKTRWRKNMVDAFNELYPNITVKTSYFPFDDYFTKLESSFAGGNAPDVMAIDAPNVPRRVEVDDVLLELDKYFAEQKNDFIDASMEEATWKGKFYAVPMYQSSQAIFYNKDMFEDAGIDPPEKVENAWTWEHFVEVAQKLQVTEDGETKVWGLVIDQWDRPYQIDAFLDSKGAELIGPDKETTDGYLNSPEAIEALEFYSNLFNKWEIAPKDPLPEAFGNGRAAMWLTGPWWISGMKSDYPDINFGVMPLPYFKDGKKASPSGSWHLGIYNETDHPKAAAKFVAHLTDWSGGDLNFQVTRYLPTRKETYRIHEESLGTPPESVFAEQLRDTASPRPRLPEYRSFENILRGAYRDIALGADPEERINQAVRRIDRQLERG